MKKTVLYFLILTFSAFIFAGCGSTKISLQENSPVALISVIGNTQVPWVSEESDVTTPTGEPEAEGLLTGLANKLSDSNNPEILTAIDRLDYACDSFAENLPRITDYEILPKDDVVKSEAYIYTSANYFNIMSSSKSATDFKDLSIIGAKNARVLMQEVGAKSAAILSLTFQKEVVKGTKSSGSIAGVVTLKAKLLDNRGHEVINKIFSTRTSEPIKIIHMQYNKDTLVEALDGAIDDVIRQFCMEISKISFSSDMQEDSDTQQEEIQATPITIKTHSVE